MQVAPIHTAAWLAWLAAALAALSLTRNPAYLIIVWGSATLTSLALRKRVGSATIPVSPLQFTGFVVLMGGLFNVLTSHFGATVLFTIPGRLPYLSGAVTLEAFLFGALNGLVLAGMFVVFSVLTQALPVRTLIRLIPGAFYPLAVVTSIAVTFIPSTLRQFEQIREAQAIRGHQVRGLRDWLPLLLPLLVGGLERALQLAEAITARGFASQGDDRDDDRYRWVLLAGLAALFAGALARLGGNYHQAGLVLILIGVVLTAGALWAIGRRAPRSAHRTENWSGASSLVLFGALLAAAACVLPVPGVNLATLSYSPYPNFHPPFFDPAIALGLLGLCAPAVIVGSLPQVQEEAA